MTVRARCAALLVGIMLGGVGCTSQTPNAIGTPVASAPAVSSLPLPVPPEPVADPAAPTRPTGPTLVATFRLALVADPCVDRDLAAPAIGEALTILDRSYALPADFQPADLVPASQAGLTGSSGTKLVRASMLDDLRAMHDAWEAAGLAMIVESAYRSYGAQRATFDSWAARLGTAEALRRSARPGHSEHQLGTAFDLTSPGWGGRFGDWATESAEGAWMVEHAWEYGFVMSYPAGAEAETCFSYEPWHWRWIGREAAAAQHASGEVLRAFLVRSADD